MKAILLSSVIPQVQDLRCWLVTLFYNKLKWEMINVMQTQTVNLSFASLDTCVVHPFPH